MLKVGIIGTGHLGSIHLNLLKKSNLYKVIGFHDIDLKRSNELGDDFVYFKDSNELINSVDVVFICSNTPSHHSIAKKCLENNKHIFIEKPIANNVDEANEVTDFAKANNLLGQVGHVERFNPAFKRKRYHKES